MFRWAGQRKAFVVLSAVVALLAGSWAVTTRDDNTAVVRAERTPDTTAVATTTTTATTAVTAVTAARPARTMAAGPRVQRVRVLPAETANRPAKASTNRGPTPTGRIAIPKIGLDHLTYEGLELSTIDHGPSHWPGTAMPGEVGNSVFPGHRTTHSRPFWDIDVIRIGDQVVFTNDTGRYTYEAREHFVVDDSETWIANPTDTPTFTIFACHPKGSARQRYVVKGGLIKSERAVHDNGTTTYVPAPMPGEEPPPTTTTTSRSLVPKIG